MSSTPIGSTRSRVQQQNNQQDGYTVKPGDNLTKIANALGIKLDTLIAANPQLKDPNFITPNQVLNLPKPAPAGTAAASTPGPVASPTTATPGANTFTTSSHEPPPQTARPGTGVATTPTVQADPQAQAQLQQNLQAINQQPKTRFAGLDFNPVKENAENVGAADLSTRTRSGVAVGARTNGIGFQKQGSSISKSTSIDGQGTRTSSTVKTDLGYGKDATAISEETSKTRKQGQVTQEHQQTSVQDRKGNSLVESQSTKAEKQGGTATTRSSSSTQMDGDQRKVATDRETVRTNAKGQTVEHELSEKRETTNLKTGKTTGQDTKVRASGGKVTEDIADLNKDGRTRSADMVRANTEATANIAAVETRSDWKGAVAKKSASIGDGTGAEGEFHALAVQGSASAAAGANLKEGKVAAGAQAGAAVDLIGASGKAQLGKASSVKGQVYVKGEAHVGAKAAVGAGVDIDPRNGTAKATVGGEAFAGAEIKGNAGYQNRYFGAEVEARGQAGAGVAAKAEIGFEKGKFKAKADIGACVGLGGRVSVNINVDVKAIYQDTKATVSNAASSAYSGAKSALSSGWAKATSWF
jgi:hypothetical protein